VETLEALEGRLLQYHGTLLVVSHDRYFLDQVVTSTLVFEGDGSVKRYAGGYSDWTRLKRTLAIAEEVMPRKATEKPARTAPSPAKKLSYKLQRELDALPERIEALEQDVDTVQNHVNAEDFYRQAQEHVREKLEKLEELQKQLETAVERWAELEDQSQKPGNS